MEKLAMLKLLLQETKYPYFSDEELNSMLTANQDNVYITASQLCLIKADGDKRVTVGPITIEGAGADYWISLSKQYATIGNCSGNTVGSYKTSMARSDNK